MEETQESISQLRSRIDALEDRINSLENFKKEGLKEEAVSSRKDISLQEFLSEKKPKNEVQKTLGVAFYAERHRKNSPFNAEDVRKEFTLGREKPPLNINDAINSNIKNGYVMESGEKKSGKKAWVLTNKGLEFVERNFQKGN